MQSLKQLRTVQMVSHAVSGMVECGGGSEEVVFALGEWRQPWSHSRSPGESPVINKPLELEAFFPLKFRMAESCLH